MSLEAKMCRFHHSLRGSGVLFLSILIAFSLAITVSLPMRVSAQITTSTPDPEVVENHRQAIIQLQDEAITPGDFDLLAELTASDYVQHNPMGDFNREQAVALLEGLHSAFSDFTIIRRQLVAEGDLVATHITISGVFDHELASANGAIPPTGKPIKLDIINMFRFDQDGKIAEEWAQFDNLGFLTQLGVMPTPTQ